MSYGISINLVEVTWKSKIKAQFPNPNDYSMFMGNFSTATGTVTFIMMLLSRVIFKKFGWGVAALITPTLLLITGLVFFSLLMFPDATGPMLAGMGMTPLYAAVLVGAAQNIFSKSAKYSLFDPCKEMAYIPLDDEVKTKVGGGAGAGRGEHQQQQQHQRQRWLVGAVGTVRVAGARVPGALGHPALLAPHLLVRRARPPLM